MRTLSNDQNHKTAILALQALAELIRDQSGVEGVRIRITEKGDNQ